MFFTIKDKKIVPTDEGIKRLKELNISFEQFVGYIEKDNFPGRFPANIILTHSPNCKLIGTKKVKSNAHSITKHECKNNIFEGGRGNSVNDFGNPYADKDGFEEVEAWECVDDCPIKILDEQSGILKSGKDAIRKNPNARGYHGNWGIGQEMTTYGDKGGASRYFKQIKVDKNDSFTYDYHRGELLCGNILESQKIVGMLNGVRKEVGNYIQNVEQFLCGKIKMENFQKDMKSIILILIQQMTELKTYNVCSVESIDCFTEEGEKIIKLLMELNIENAKDVENISLLIIFKNELLELTKDIVKTAREKNLLSGEKKTENIITPTCESITKNESQSRFFYCAKASKKERDMGCEDLEIKHVTCRPKSDDEDDRTIQERLHGRKAKNFHPTVKPLSLCEYFIKLTTTQDAIILDPFAGSGSTLIAAKKLGRRCLGIEKEKEYCEIAARIKVIKNEQTP